jgi:hypothetical protein
LLYKKVKEDFMTDNPSPESSLTAELRELGKNLVEAMRAAWEQPERKRFQQEITNGLSDLGNTLKSEATKLQEHPTTQRLRTNVSTAGQRIRSGEVEDKVREDLLTALRNANQQLEQTVRHLNERQSMNVGASRTEDEPTTVATEVEEASPGPHWTNTANPDKGADQSSMDPEQRKPSIVNPDDVGAPPSDTGHREINPDDVDN